MREPSVRTVTPRERTRGMTVFPRGMTVFFALLCRARMIVIGFALNPV